MLPAASTCVPASPGSASCMQCGAGNARARLTLFPPAVGLGTPPVVPPRQIAISKDDTVILNGGGSRAAIAERCDMIRQAMEVRARGRGRGAGRRGGAAGLLKPWLAGCQSSAAACCGLRLRCGPLVRPSPARLCVHLPPGPPPPPPQTSTSDYDREKLQERLAKLSGGVAVLKVCHAALRRAVRRP